jgi:archaellum component FlaF (FlaF/FlaG flagellin family)
MSGTGTAAAAAIILVGVVIGLILAEPSLEDAADDLRETRKESSEKSLEIMNTRMEMTSVSLNNTTKVLNITISNTGSTVIEIRHLDVLVNGTWTNADFGGGEYIYPSGEVRAGIEGIYEVSTVKIVSRYGIADQTSEIEIKT